VRRHLELSVEGERLFQAATMGLGHIATVCDDIRRSTTLEQVTIAATHAFSSFWLMPRIRTFQQQYPDIKVHVVATDNAKEQRSEKVDLALTCGDSALQGHETHYLFAERAYPVCSPSYLSAHTLPEKPTQLLTHRLLHMDEQVWENLGWDPIDWPAWLQHFGVDVSNLKPSGLTFNNYYMLIQAALEGEGISLGFEHSIGDLVAKGKLITLTKEYWDTGRGYYLAIRSNRIDNPQVQALSQWLLSSF
jgi:DNA-binding transcriptional LysR family regulator